MPPAWFRAAAARVAPMLFALAGCHRVGGIATGPDGHGMLKVPLYVAAQPMAVGSLALESGFALDPVFDERQEKTIGIDREEDVELYAAEQTPAALVDQVVRIQMEACGLRPTAGAPVRIHIRLTHFHAEEDRLYRGEVAATVEVRDASGKILNSRTIGGSSRSWGRTLSRENFAEALSSAAFDFAKNMLQDKNLFAPESEE
jgi:YajG family uncharacterized lipoprotein